MKCKFYNGQKVTMINNSEWEFYKTKLPSVGRNPVFGEVYTVSGVEELWRGKIFIYLFEFPDQPYEHEAFKPVQSTETGMSILRRLLKTRELEHVR
jgi:hypothetical protein